MTVNGMYICMKILKWVQGSKYTQNHICKAKNTPHSRYYYAKSLDLYDIWQTVF